MHAQRYFVLGGAQVAVGAAAIFARFALTGARPLAVSALRLAIAAGILWLVLRLRSQRADAARPAKDETAIPQHDTSMRRHDKLFVIAGIALAVHFAAWISSLDYTSVAISTLLVATTPVWTALYDAVVLRKNLSGVAWAAMLAGGIGVFAIVGTGNTEPPLAGHQLLGCAFAVIGAIAIGSYFLMIREVRAFYGTQQIVTRTYSWAALALVLAAAVARQAPPPLTDGVAWGGIAAMAMISQLLGHTAMNAALRWFSASAVAFTTLVEPIVAAALAYAIFGERLTLVAILGGVLVLAAIAVFLREEQRLDRMTAS